MVEKAKSLTLSQVKKSDYGEMGKYINVTDGKGKKATVGINQYAVDKDLKFAGYNLLVTSEIEIVPEEKAENAFSNKNNFINKNVLVNKNLLILSKGDIITSIFFAHIVNEIKKMIEGEGYNLLLANVSKNDISNMIIPSSVNKEVVNGMVCIIAPPVFQADRHQRPNIFVKCTSCP